MTAPKRAKIFLIDDHPLVRESLSSLIQRHDDLLVSGEAGDTETALAKLAEVAADLVIVDLSLGGQSGIDLIRQIRMRLPSVAIIVLSMHDERVYAERAIRAGARGYIMKRESTRKIIEAIHAVLGGSMYLSKELTESFAEKFVSGPQPGGGLPIQQLSDRELEVFRMIGEGYETREIARTLNLNMKTVQTYCTRIKDKLKFSSGGELLREAMRWTESLTEPRSR